MLSESDCAEGFSRTYIVITANNLTFEVALKYHTDHGSAPLLELRLTGNILANLATCNFLSIFFVLAVTLRMTKTLHHLLIHLQPSIYYMPSHYLKPLHCQYTCYLLSVRILGALVEVSRYLPSIFSRKYRH